MINAKYTLGALMSIPLLPLLYVQGKRIRASIPDLPEAINPEGKVDLNAAQTIQVLTVGESTIAGVGVETHQEGFSGTLAHTLAHKLQKNVHWKVYAKSGYTAQDVKNRITPTIQEEAVDLMVIGLGGNDAFKLNHPKRWRSQVNALVQAIREKYPQTPIVFNNMPPIKTFPAFTPSIKFVIGNLVEILGKELELLCHTLPNVHYHSRVITLEDWIHRLQVNAEPKDFYSDGVHPSKLAYQIWARDMVNFMMENEVFQHQDAD
ncbi:MAG: SGNH/GDSL hydrolase family protein [Flammeovirgaceae bacterium]